MRPHLSVSTLAICTLLGSCVSQSRYEMTVHVVDSRTRASIDDALAVVQPLEIRHPTDVTGQLFQGESRRVRHRTTRDGSFTVRIGRDQVCVVKVLKHGYAPAEVTIDEAAGQQSDLATKTGRFASSLTRTARRIEGLRMSCNRC